MPPVQPVRPAATVILVREMVRELVREKREPGFEIFMLRRTSKAAFAGGMYVFPGGRVDHDDHLHKYDAYRTGPSDLQEPQLNAIGHEWRGFYIASLRESFEEAGLLLAYTQDGSLLNYNDPAVAARFDGYREPLHDNKLSLAEICETEKLKLALDRVHFYNRFVTPLGRPRRFDTRFFVAEAPAGQAGYHDDIETVDSIWISPLEALARNKAKEFDLMNVTRMQLEKLAEFASAADLLLASARNTEFPVHRPRIPTDLPTSQKPA